MAGNLFFMSPTRVIICALLLLWPAAVRAGGEKPYYFIAVQNGSYNFDGGIKQLEESYKALEGMVKLADAQGVRLTLLFSAQYAVYISSDPARLAEVEGWKKTGHEIGAYHQGPDTRAWDGYSDLPPNAAPRAGKEEEKGAPAPGHREYLAALNRLEPGIKTGCIADGGDKKFMAAAPPNEVCGGPALAAGTTGVNRFLAVSAGKRTRKGLSSFHPVDKAGLAAAEKYYSGMASGVYGASFKSSPSEFGAFYAWLGFLKGLDPYGLRSRTVAVIVASALLPEKAVPASPAARKAEKQAVQAQPGPPQREIPRLKPVQSQYGGKAGGLIPGLRRRMRNMDQHGYCGDGICDAFERAHAGSCPRDCGQ